MYKKQNILQMTIRKTNQLFSNKYSFLKNNRGTSVINNKNIEQENKIQQKYIKKQLIKVESSANQRITYLKDSTNTNFQRASSNLSVTNQRQKQKQRSQIKRVKQKQLPIYNNFLNLFDNIEVKRRQFNQRSKEWQIEKIKQKQKLEMLGNKKQNNENQTEGQNKQNCNQKIIKQAKINIKPGGLTGLVNIGNTCFMNSTLQCMFNIPNFNEYFLENRYKKQIKFNGKVAEAYAKLIVSIRNSNNKYQSPIQLKNSLGSRNSIFLGYSQQDSQQLLVTLLHNLNEDLSRVDKKKIPYKQLTADTKKNTLQQISDNWWKYYKERDNSIIFDYFSGQLLSRVTCLKCQNQSIAFDNFWDLSLSFIKPQLSNQISKMIEHFLKQQVLSDDYFCSSCKQLRKSKRKFSIYRLPNVLVIQLKRFSYGKWKKEKINLKVLFPDLLDLSKFVKDSKDTSVKNPTYKLIGVVNHSGGIDYGHYTADCRNPFNKKWYTFNDSVVSESDYNNKNNYQSNSPYLLFYFKQS